jgi:hypothetical protein
MYVRNGYICETVVAVDLDNVRHLKDKLLNRLQSQGLPNATERVASLTRKLVGRLDTYLADLRNTAPIPSILFGRLYTLRCCSLLLRFTSG